MSWQANFVFWRVGLLFLSLGFKSFLQEMIFFSVGPEWISI
jgi:hypothetical protein